LEDTDILEPFQSNEIPRVEIQVEKKAEKAIAKVEKSSAELGGRWKCLICAYVYDPVNGDPDSGIAPGTPFEDIPDDWFCPVCGSDKSNFAKI